VKELALYILDLAENSISAGAKHVSIDVQANSKSDKLIVRISDYGKGMSADLLARVTDPFVTSRKERRFGLGLPFFKDLVEQCEGSFSINSEEGKGTTVEGTMKLSSVDLVPMGDMGATIVSMLVSNPSLDIIYSFVFDDYDFCFDSEEVRRLLGNVSITEPSVLQWIAEYVNQGTREILPNATHMLEKKEKEGAYGNDEAG
jgi:anti-sigma regulatory factor (Ser/Thr protein kinase)